jgi:hypothetical protein
LLARIHLREEVTRVRDTFIALLIIAGVVGGYYWSAKRSLQLQSQQIEHKTSDSVPPSKEVARRTHVPISLPLRNSIKKTKTQGAKNESNRHGKTRKAQAHRAFEGVGRSDDEDQKLPSIYSSQETGQPESTVDTASNDLTEPAAGSSQVSSWGVPVRAWIKSRRNQILAQVPNAEDGSGLRLFVGCVELSKKDGSKFNEKECSEMLARSQTKRSQTY